MGSISGIKVAGYCACPTCGPELKGRRAPELKKIVYHEHRRLLPDNHIWRRNRRHWRRFEPGPAPNGPSVEAQLAMCELVESGVKTPKETGMNRRSILWDLPYWRMLLVRFLLDAMHIEVNICKNVMKHLYNKSSDTLAVRRDAKLVGTVKGCWVNEETEEVPPAPWVIPRDILKNMNGMLSEMRFPSHYGAGLRGSTSRSEFTPPIGLKSHDYHKIMQHMLPITLRACDNDLGRKILCLVIYDLSEVFRYMLSHRDHVLNPLSGVKNISWSFVQVKSMLSVV